ncbi:MAG: hypothetical protein H5T70_07760, partial [Chloroflexi bacterium]|nr:hypothetical protein [Chloroflexota bacterium]
MKKITYDRLASSFDAGGKMISEDGTISFVQELLDLLDRFLCEYEEIRGPLGSDLERGLVITYLLGVLRCDARAIGECVASAPAFGNIHPRLVYEECVGRNPEIVAERQK